MTRIVTIALASPAIARGVDDALETCDRMAAEAAGRGAAIACFPEAWIPGLRGNGFDVPDFDAAAERRVVDALTGIARERAIALIAGVEHHADGGRQIASVVIDGDGSLLGRQPKCQLDPSEESHYVAGRGRTVFETAGLRFGISICHEGWRYPETVRWAARAGASIVFHPQLTGSDVEGRVPRRWCDPEAPYYEKAMTCRALENTIWFASVNYAVRFQESATAVIAPDGALHARLQYGEEGVLVTSIDLDAATGLLARRWAPERLPG